jgi:exopolysaccharide production protein ExoQ
MDEVAKVGHADAQLSGYAAVTNAVPVVKRKAAQAPARAGLAEQFFVVTVLVLSTTAFINLLPGESGVEYEEQGKFVAQIVWLALYIIMLFFVRTRVGELLRLVWQNKLLVLLLGWACVSAVWSIDRQVTVRHFIALLLCAFFGAYLGIRYNLREQLRFVLIALGIVITASIGACLLFPSYGFQTDDDLLDKPAWQGVFSGKNMLGRFAVLATLILLIYFLKGIRRGIVIICIILLFVIIVLTQAKTSLVYFVLGMVAFPFVRAFLENPLKRRKIVTVALLVFGGLAVWTYYHWEDFTDSLGKDPELTGRFALWGLSVTWIAERPLLGYGYDAFWSDYYGPAAEFRAASGWLTAPHAHNGIINLWLDLGLIGVILLVVSVIAVFRRAVEMAMVSTSVEEIWPIMFLLFYLLYSISETTFMPRNDLLWILYVSLMVGLRCKFAPTAQPSLLRV